MAVYGAAKAFVLSFTESLWAETRSTGVTVFALSPGATALTHLARRNPGPCVIDGRLNRLSATAARLMSRRGTAR